MNIISKNITLRALEPEDLDVLYQWENNATLWHLSNTLVPFSRYILKQYIESSYQDIYQTKQLRLIIEKNDTRKVIGAIDLFDFDPSNLRAGIGILVGDKNDRGKGYAYEALQKLIEYCFSTLLLKQLYCNILSKNVESINLFTKAGFELIGNKKKWIRIGDEFYDELILQLIK